MAKGNIKSGGGSDIRSPVYAQMGSLSRKPRGLGRAKPFRGQKMRSRSR
jgi:hypothetical protein